MLIYLSGGGAPSVPERILSRSAVMLSFVNDCKRGRPGTRYRRLVEIRNESPGRHKHFLDSGAFTLFSRHVASKRTDPTKPDDFSYYESEDFWHTVDKYARFLKRNKEGYDHYANLDVIRNPKLTWEVQQYLENCHKLDPVPVIHLGTPMKWIKLYLDRGYDHIALGGFGHGGRSVYVQWANEAFDLICSKPKLLPCVRVHGFAITSFDLLWKYPWWSVDSASWTQAAGYGNVFIPHRRNGKWTFSIKPFLLPLSDDASQRTGKISPNKAKRFHLASFSPELRRIIHQWFDHIAVPIGSVDKWGDMMKWGVVSAFAARAEANIKFFDMFQNSFPEWPRSFKSSSQYASFNL